MKRGDKIFVYGTLRPGASNAGIMQQGAEHIGSDTLTGALIYDLGWFPGLQIINTDDIVVGDVFEITDDKLPARLDSYEGYPHMYKRVQVLTDEGHKAWVYTYNGQFHNDSVVESGDWLQHNTEEV